MNKYKIVNCFDEEKEKKDLFFKAFVKKQEQKRKFEIEEEYARNYKHVSCYCHIGNPPCSFCTDSE